MKLRISSFLFALALPAFAWIANADAVSVRLRTGDLLSGDVVSTDTDGFKLKRWDNGGVVAVQWEHLAVEDARRMRKILTLPEEAEREMIEIVRIQTKNGSFLEGKILEENADKITLRTKEGTKHIPAGSVLKREISQIEATSLYTPKELYDEKAKGVTDTDPSGQFDLGSLCMRLQMWPEAEQHFKKALELDASLKDKVDQRLAMVSRKRKDGDSIALVKATRDLIDDRKAKDARASFDKLKADYGDLVAKADLESLESDLVALEKGGAGTNNTAKAPDDKLFKDFCTILGTQLKLPAADRTVNFDTAKTYIEQIVYKEVARDLAKRLKMKPEDFDDRWNKRNVAAMRRATYGEGTWVIEGRKTKKKDEGGAPTSLDDLKKMQEADKIIEDLWAKDRRDFKLLQEDWWKAASAERRLAWLEAYAAEKLFLVDHLEWPKCRNCGGKGLAGKDLCKTCQGVKNEKVVVYH